MEYFFAGQLRSYRIQIIRAFSNFSVSVGTNDDGTPRLKRVPCRYGDSSRIAETIITGNSENKMPTAPFISVYVNNVELAPERRAAPSLVSTVNVAERTYDEGQQKYLNTQGNRYTVQRYMPVPFTLRVNVDFWTTNLNQKEELFEQTQVLFNGMVDIQTSNNPLDWTLFSTIEPQGITWTSRNLPIGTENPIDVMTVEYKVPVWINPPALVTYSKMIEQIVTNINEGTYDPTTMEWTETDLLTRNITTPDNARIHVSLVSDGFYELSLRTVSGSDVDEKHQPTIITGSQVPQLQPGAAFSVNGVAITVPNNNINDLINVMRNMFQGKNLSVLINLANKLQLINLSGGDLVLANITGSQIEGLGFVATTYPGGTLAWWRLIDQYGTLKTVDCPGGSSELMLLTSDNLDDRSGDIQGTTAYHPINQNLMYWTVISSTWPTATMNPLTAIINPQSAFPGQGLAPAAFAQRYLLSDQIAVTSAAWGEVTARPTAHAQIAAKHPTDPRIITIDNLTTAQLQLDRPCFLQTSGSPSQVLQVTSILAVSAGSWQIVLAQDCFADVGNNVAFVYPVEPNDIIEYDGNNWQLVFDSINTLADQFVKNNFSQKWYKWQNQTWTAFPYKGSTGDYGPGYWRLSL
jgi:hypothetical protein